MTTLRDIFTAFAPEYLERYPHLPTSHRKVISTIQYCQSGHYGHSLYRCPSCGEQGMNHGVGHPIWGYSRRIRSAKNMPDDIQRLTSYLKDTWDDWCVNIPSYWRQDAEKLAAMAIL
jgi:hypothetical protein